MTLSDLRDDWCRAQSFRAFIEGLRLKWRRAPRHTAFIPWQIRLQHNVSAPNPLFRYLKSKIPT